MRFDWLRLFFFLRLPWINLQWEENDSLRGQIINDQIYVLCEMLV